MLQNFLAGFGGVGGACALITLGLKLWPGALDTLATALYSHVRPERLPYDSPLSQHFAKTRTLGERTSKFDDRMDELCRDTIKNTIISLIYGDQAHDHSGAVRYELAKFEKTRRAMPDRQRRRKILGGPAVSGPVALVAYLILLALIIVFHHGARRHCFSHWFSKPSHSGMAFLLPLDLGREGDVMDDIVMTPEMTPQGDSLPPDDIQTVSEEDAAKAVEGLED